MGLWCRIFAETPLLGQTCVVPVDEGWGRRWGRRRRLGLATNKSVGDTALYWTLKNTMLGKRCAAVLCGTRRLRLLVVSGASCRSLPRQCTHSGNGEIHMVLCAVPANLLRDCTRSLSNRSPSTWANDIHARFSHPSTSFSLTTLTAARPSARLAALSTALPRCASCLRRALHCRRAAWLAFRISSI